MKKAINLLEKGVLRRILSLTLAVCMIGTLSLPLTAAQASGVLDSGEILLSGFAVLPNEVRKQSVLLGTFSAELALPDTLKAMACPVLEDIGPVLPVESSKPQEPLATLPSVETPPSSEESTPPTEETVSPTEESPPPVEAAPPVEESALPEVTPPIEQQPESTSAAEAEISEKSMVPLAASPSHVESDDEPSDSELLPEATLPIDEDEGTPVAVTITGVTWDSIPLYDPNTMGTYVFTAVLPDGYTVEGGVSLPKITVTVGAEQSAVDKVTALIDALPSYVELTADPPGNTDSVYVAWLAKTQQTLTDIKAAKAAYDALTDEEKAQIDAIRTAKLLELAELAEQMALMMPMSSTREADSYETLVTAITEANDGDTINITADFTRNEGEFLNITKNLTIDGQNHTITANNYASVFIIDSDGITVTIQDLIMDGTDQHWYTNPKPGIQVLMGSLTLENTAIIGFPGAGVKVDSRSELGATLTMESGTITKNRTSGLLVRGSKSSFTMNGGKIIANKVIYDDSTGNVGSGGGIEIVNAGAFTMNGGEITDNIVEGEAGARGGGVYVWTEDAIFNMTGGSIENNTAPDGGGVYTSRGVKFTMSGGSIENNTATNFGGGIFAATGSTTTLAGAVIKDNRSTTDGGGLYVNCSLPNAPTSFTMTDVNITGNIAQDGNGGGVYLISLPEATANLNMKNSKITGNKAINGNGGGICVTGNSALNVGGEVDITNNSATGSTPVTTPTNNVYLATSRMIGITSALTGSMDIHVQTPPIVGSTTALKVAEGSGYTIGDDDFKVITSDYKKNSETDNSKLELVMGTNSVWMQRPGKNDLGGLSLSVAGATLVPSFASDVTDYTAEVEYSVGSVDITATLAEAAITAGGTIKLQTNNDTPEDMTSGSAKTKTLGVGKNKFVIRISTADFITKLYTLVITRKEMPNFTVAIDAYKDGAAWMGHGKLFKLVDGDTEITDLTAVPSGTYRIYAGVADTSVNVTVNGAAGSVKFGAALTAPTITKTGYTLNDWNPSVPATMPAANITCTAQWTASSNTPYKVEFYQQDIIGNGYTIVPDDTENKTGTTDTTATVTPVAGKYPGFTYNAAAAGNQLSGTIVADGGLVLKVYYDRNTYPVSFHSQNGSDIGVLTGVRHGATIAKPTDPTRTGYIFAGWYKESTCTNVWTFATDTITTAATLYAKWADNQAPTISAAAPTAPASGWFNADQNLTLTYHDNEGVTALAVSVDGGGYTTITLGTTYTISAEGTHTYRFKATDAEGLVGESGLVTVMLDKTPPTIDALEYENKAANLWDWIIGKKSLVIVVPVTESGSGASQISYTVTPTAGTPTTKNASISGAKAEITFDTEFKGQINITCTDNAGNVSSSVMVGVSGVIVEERPPEITMTPPAGANADGWYSAAVDVAVTVQDNDISGGLKQIQWKIGTDGSVTTITAPFTASLTTSHSFTIPVSTTGEQTIYVRAADHAGNESTWVTEAVKLDTQVPTLAVTGGTTGAEYLALSVTPSFGASGGKVTVGGGSADVTGSYAVNDKGAYVFIATSNAGKSSAAVTTTVHGITFDSTGGSSVANQIVADGGKTTHPTDPEKMGFGFVKWQTGEMDFNFETDIITTDTTLTAVWTIAAPTVGLAVDHPNGTYNGGAAVATLTATPTHAASGVTYTYEWYRDSIKLTGTAAVISLTDVSHSGSYTVKVTAHKDGQTSAQTESSPVAVTVAKAPVTFVVTGNEYNYDNTAKTATVMQTADEMPSVTGHFTVSYEQGGAEVSPPPPL